jgi:hypothetical protein
MLTPGQRFGTRAVSMDNNALDGDANTQLVATIDQLTELVTSRFSTLDRRLQELEADTAEIRHLLRAIVSSMERLNSRLPYDRETALFEGEEVDDGFLAPPAGHFLH